MFIGPELTIAPRVRTDLARRLGRVVDDHGVTLLHQRLLTQGVDPAVIAEVLAEARVLLRERQRCRPPFPPTPAIMA